MTTIPKKLQQRIAEDIALQFHVLDTTGVVLRAKNTIPSRGKTDHQLSLKYERRLASALAFISHTKKDSDHVTAAAVYESDSSLHVLVAANAANSSYLNDVGRGFEEIAKILEDARTTNRSILLDKVLSVIIKLCRPRIKARLRIPRLKKYGSVRPPWKNSLLQVMTQLRRNQVFLTEPTGMLSDSLEVLSIHIDKLQNENAPSPNDFEVGLRRVVEICYEMNKTNDLHRSVSHRLRAGGVDESMFKSVLNLVKKIGHYKTCAVELIKMAQSFPFISTMQTTIVRLKEADRAYLALNSDINLAVITKRVLPSPITVNETQWLKERGDGTSSPGKTRRGEAILCFQQSAKIHAEIQIMRYIDSHREIRRPPRVIRASKDSCHLCHTFISSDGRYDIGKSHGKVYPGWRLPAIGNRMVYVEFAERLERGMMPHLRGKKPGDKASNFEPAACESTISTGTTSLASLATDLPGLSPVQNEEDGPGSQSEGSEATIRGPKMQDSDEEISSSITSVPGPVPITRDQDQDIASHAQEGEVPSFSSRHPCTTVQLARVTETQTTHRTSYYVRPSQELELFFDHDSRVQKGGSSDGRPRVRLLTAYESERAQAESFVYDLDKELLPGQEIACPAGSVSFCLEFRGKVYSVELKPPS